MNYDLNKIQAADIKGKTVFLRADLDVPLGKAGVGDDSRLKAWYPTLEFLLNQDSKVIIAGHLGRPEGKDQTFSLKPVADWLAEKITGQTEKEEIAGFDAWKITDRISLLENLRFYKEEEENSAEFAQRLSQLAQVYVNDAFASSHRAHASIAGITEFLPSFAGLRLQKEVLELSKVIDHPQRPLCVIIGGAKIETKLPLVEKMHSLADFVLVGGELSEKDSVLIRLMHQKADKVKAMLFVADLKDSKKEITDYATENFIQVINKSKTVVWNGPLGQIEEEEYAGETRKLAQAIAKSQAYSIVGGGDTVAFLQHEGLADKFSFVSTGGGAMLELLAGEKLPGLLALTK